MFMIVLNYENLEQFLFALQRRISNEVFAQYVEGKNSQDENSTTHTMILQFLGRVDPNVLALHQCSLKLQKQEEKDELIQTLQQSFEKAGDIQLIQGKIIDIMMSLA